MEQQVMKPATSAVGTTLAAALIAIGKQYQEGLTCPMELMNEAMQAIVIAHEGLGKSKSDCWHGGRFCGKMGCPAEKDSVKPNHLIAAAKSGEEIEALVAWSNDYSKQNGKWPVAMFFDEKLMQYGYELATSDGGYTTDFLPVREHEMTEVGKRAAEKAIDDLFGGPNHAAYFWPTV